MGGAPKHLQNIAIYLGELGHSVTVLCTTAAESNQIFRWHENVTIRPELPFKQPFPQPYDVPAYQLAQTVQTVAESLDTADRFYMHDGEFLFPYVYAGIPTVVSLRDSVYPETQLGGFLFQGDELITISEHSRQYYLNTVGRYLPELADRTHVIHNGIDWERFSPTPPREILDIVPVDPAVDTVIIHPHRPEPSKGLPQTLAVVDLLVHRYGLRQVRVLVPRWLDTGQSAEVRAFYEAMQQDIARRGISDNFIFHDWIPQNLMPQYFSLGAVTLALGHFVESFGNAVYESLGCGTPSIAARVATHRELLPDHLLDKVHFDDADSAAALAADIIRTRRRTASETLDYLRQHYSIERQLTAYARLILNARKRPPLNYQHRQLTSETKWRLAPWCYQWGGGVYHDYLAEHRQMPDLQQLLAQFPDGFTITEAIAADISEEAVKSWYRLGYIVPWA